MAEERIPVPRTGLNTLALALAAEADQQQAADEAVGEATAQTTAMGGQLWTRAKRR